MKAYKKYLAIDLPKPKVAEEDHIVRMKEKI